MSVLFLFFTGALVGQQEKRSGASPNIIIFIADDVSASDLGAYGNSYVQTPNIDKLAENGVRFNNAILTTSSCSPSRIRSIITGRYPHNTGAAELHTQPEVAFETIASELQDRGYYTGQAGKWHMGDLIRQGFHKIFEGKVNGDGGEDKCIPSLEMSDKDKPFFFLFASLDAQGLAPGGAPPCGKPSGIFGRVLLQVQPEFYEGRDI